LRQPGTFPVAVSWLTPLDKPAGMLHS
jgi:hypothetical protein